MAVLIMLLLACKGQQLMLLQQALLVTSKHSHGGVDELFLKTKLKDFHRLTRVPYSMVGTHGQQLGCMALLAGVSSSPPHSLINLS